MCVPIRSAAREPRFSPRIVTRVPGGPSLGDSPVTTGGGPIIVVFLLWAADRD